MKRVGLGVVAGTYRIVIEREGKSRRSERFYREIEEYVRAKNLQLMGLSAEEANERLTEIAIEAEERNWEVAYVDTGGDDWGVWLRGDGITMGIASGLE